MPSVSANRQRATRLESGRRWGRHALALVLLVLVPVLPAMEFACDGQASESHERGHVHVTLAVAEVSAPNPLRPPAAQRITMPHPAERLATTSFGIFVPPRG